MRYLLILAVLALAFPSHAAPNDPKSAGRTQGAEKAGGATTTNPVQVGGVDGSGNVRALKTTAAGDLSTDTGPRTSNQGPSEYCMVTTAGGTTVSLPANTKWFQICNGGPYPIRCTYDNTAPVSGVTGERVGALASTDDFTPWDCTKLRPVTANTVVKCIAKTATQVTGGCAQLYTVQ